MKVRQPIPGRAIILASKVAYADGNAVVVGVTRTDPPRYTILSLATGQRIENQFEGDGGIQLIDTIPRDDDDEIPRSYREWAKSRQKI